MEREARAMAHEPQAPARPQNSCFGCGQANAAGMHLEFSFDEEKRKVVGTFSLGERYQGAAGIIHGGIVALVLDEGLSKVSRLYGVRAVTAQLNVEYLKPVRVGEEIHFEAHQEKSEGRRLFRAGEIRDVKGRGLARASATFVIVDPEKFVRGAGKRQE